MQIDESKVGSRKYNRGKRVEGHWVIGMIANHSHDLRIVVCPENKRGEKELIPIIKNHVKKGTTIRTDCWKGYCNLKKHGFKHKTVNHSDADKRYRFVGRDGTHTNRIESHWRPMKDFYRSRHVRREYFAEHLAEFSWRRFHKKRGKDLFYALISSIRNFSLEIE